MVQVLAVEVIVMLVEVEVNADGASASASVLYMISVLIVLLGNSIPGADILSLYLISVPFPLMPMMIPAFGEILGSAVRADGARPPLSGTHCGLQRRCGAGVGKRSAVFGSPAELASPIRLDYMSARQPDKAVRPARIRGKRYGRLWPDKPSTDSHPVIPPAMRGTW